MDTRQELLRAIAGSPDDDTPRLVFADWLEENGDSTRAEFIRIQIELARTAPPPGSTLDSCLSDLRDREQVLLRENWHDWTAPLRDKLAESIASVEYERGFPQEIGVRGVSVVVKNGFFDEPQTATELNVGPPAYLAWHDEMLRALVRYPGAVNLTGLSFRDHPAGNAAARHLADSHALRNLRSLDFRYGRVTENGLDHLARSQGLPNLTTLNLHATEVNDSCVEVLVGTRSRLRLKSLALGLTRIGDAGVEALARSPKAAALEELHLGRLDLTERAVRALAASPFMKNLRVLDLHENDVTPDAASALYQSDLTSQAKWSALSSMGFDNLAGEVLRQGGGHTPGVRKGRRG